jgi:hypothetical protein
MSGLGVAALGGAAQAADPVPAANDPVRPAALPSWFAPDPLTNDPQWGVLVFGGVSAGRSPLIKLMAMPWTGSYGNDYFVGTALSHRVFQLAPHWLIEAEAGAGYRFKQADSPEAWIGLFLRYDGFPWNNVVYTTVAINTGLSYVEQVSELEKAAGASRGNPNGSNLLHYLAPEITFASPENRNLELVFRYHHRSGIFGTINGMWGGSNVTTFGIRQRW